MGSGASKKNIGIYICPPNYDKTRFKYIMKYFDSLDNDGNNGLFDDELIHLSELHSNDTINNLKLKHKMQIKTFQKKKKQFQMDHEQENRRLESKYIMLNKTLENDHEITINDLNKSILHFQGMTKKNKLQSLKHTIGQKTNTKGQAHLDFWNFFELIKHMNFDIGKFNFDKEDEIITIHSPPESSDEDEVSDK